MIIISIFLSEELRILLNLKTLFSKFVFLNEQTTS